MQNLLNTLSGKKTYIVAVVLAVLNLAVAFNWVNTAELVQINWFLAALGLGALRAGITKAGV